MENTVTIGEIYFLRITDLETITWRMYLHWRYAELLLQQDNTNLIPV